MCQIIDYFFKWLKFRKTNASVLVSHKFDNEKVPELELQSWPILIFRN